MNNKSILSILGLILVLNLFSCKDEVEVPNTDGIDVQLKIVRFEDELFKLDANNMDAALKKLHEKYPAFYTLYFNQVLPLTKDSTKLAKAVKNFIKDPAMLKLKDTSHMVVNNFKEIEKELTSSLKLAKYYFPEYKEPTFYTFISEYSFQNFIFKDIKSDGVGIGLDMFLGASFDYKRLDPQNANFSDYITRTFNKDHIVSKSMQTIIDDWVGSQNGGRLIDQMIHNGKKLYIKKKLLPTTHDTLIFEYSAAQMQWVKENELEIWSFFIDQNLMYESRMSSINKYINDSPNAPGMPKEAPGKTANYIGYKIIEAYMNKNDNLELSDLIKDIDAQLILDESRYKPKRR